MHTSLHIATIGTYNVSDIYQSNTSIALRPRDIVHSIELRVDRELTRLLFLEYEHLRLITHREKMLPAYRNNERAIAKASANNEAASLYIIQEKKIRQPSERMTVII